MRQNLSYVARAVLYNDTISNGWKPVDARTLSGAKRVTHKLFSGQHFDVLQLGCVDPDTYQIVVLADWRERRPANRQWVDVKKECEV